MQRAYSDSGDASKEASRRLSFGIRATGSCSKERNDDDTLCSAQEDFGDYLALNMPSGTGRLIRDSINLGGQERCVFSCRCELLVTKFGRSSKPQPRILVLTAKSVFMVVQAIVNNALSISSERTIPIGAVKYISCSTLKDDWFSLGVSSPQEPDPLINCPFKTEFFLQFRTVSHGAFNLRIADSIEYNKKPGKPATVKVVKDPTVPRDDLYKSGTIHTNQGESPNSISRPTPKGKAVARPITSGKLLRKGGPGGQQSKTASRPRPTPAINAQRTVPTSAVVNRPVAQLNGDTGPSHSSTITSGSRIPAPPAAAPANVTQKSNTISKVRTRTSSP